MAENMKTALEQHMETLGKNLEGTIEEWRAADADNRQELDGRIKGLEDTIGEVKETLNDESRFHLPGVEVSKNGERDAFSMARACRALARKDFTDAPYEQEVFQATKERAMSAGVDPSGGYIVPEDAITAIIESLKANVVAYDLGARDLAASGIPVTIPKISSSATGYWVYENATITASDLGFEQINMTPKTVAGRVILSNLLLETSTPTADSVIEQDLASQLGLALDLGVLDGTGAAGQPTGIMNTAGISSATLETIAAAASGIGAPPSIQTLLEMVSDLDAANAPTGTRGWAIHPLMVSEMRQMEVNFAGVSTPLTAVNTGDGMREFFLGFPFRQTTQMTAPTTAPVSTKSVLFGNWDDVMIARWGGLRLLASDTSDDAFSKDQTHIRATMRCDVALRHPESFSYSL